MKPKIDHTEFGSITVAGITYDHDILIRMDGQVKKRKKKLSKEVYGTSHVVSEAEAKDIYEKGAERLVVGCGQSGVLELSEKAKEFFNRNKCQVTIAPTPQAVKAWNAGGADGLISGELGFFGKQVFAVAVTAAFSAAGTFVILKVVEALVGLRTTTDEEREGLDINLHGEEGYAIGSSSLGRAETMVAVSAAEPAGKGSPVAVS